MEKEKEEVVVNWEILIGLLSIAVSIFFGLNGLAGRLSAKIDMLASRMDILATKRDILAMLLAFSKASNERRAIALNDLKEGYSVAEEFFSRADSY